MENFGMIKRMHCGDRMHIVIEDDADEIHQVNALCNSLPGSFKIVNSPSGVWVTKLGSDKKRGLFMNYRALRDMLPDESIEFPWTTDADGPPRDRHLDYTKYYKAVKREEHRTGKQFHISGTTKAMVVRRVR